jgi:hypothetical protein
LSSESIGLQNPFPFDVDLKETDKGIGWDLVAEPSETLTEFLKHHPQSGILLLNELRRIIKVISYDELPSEEHSYWHAATARQNV